MQQGVIQIASLASNNAAVFAPSLYVIDLSLPVRGPIRKAGPSSSKSWDELDAKTIKESGNRIIGWLDLGYRHVLATSRSAHPYQIEDLKGLEIRVPNNPVMINTFRAWGGEPDPPRAGTKPSTPFSRRSSTAKQTRTWFSCPTSLKKCRST